MSGGPSFTPQLQQELNQLTLQRLYQVCEKHQLTEKFWRLSSMIIERLHNKVSND